MSAARASSSRALRQLSVHSNQVRNLHMTGPATFPSRGLTSEKHVRSKDFTAPRADAVRRGMPSVAPKEEPLPNNAGPSARTIVTAHGPSRPQPTHSSIPQKSTREINTSRSLHTPNDTSTMDFAFLPAEPAPVPMDNVNLRVPLIPDNFKPRRTGAHALPASDYDNIFRAQVVTAAGEATYVGAPSIMKDVQDNHSVHVDYGALADRMEATADAMEEEANQSRGTIGQLWNGMIDDVFGPRRAFA